VSAKKGEIKMTIEDKQVDLSVQKLPRKKELPYWEAPRTARQCLSRIKNMTTEWVKVTEFTIYKVGKEFIWLKNNKLEHGEFAKFVAQTPYTLRTVQRLMKHARECDDVERLLPYHPNKGGKNDTVSLLEPPEIDDKSKLGIIKPDHEPLAWSAQESAEALLKFFEKLTQRRNTEEMEDVAERFQELVREYIESRKEDRLMIGGGMAEDRP
jgi:hypothetical protein